MKRQFWTGGVLLIMILWGLTGCGGPKAPMPGGDASEPPDRMADGPGMVYTPEDQTPFAGTWRDADSTVVLEIEGQGAGERSRMKATVNGEPTFEAEVWVHASGNVKLTKVHKDILPPEPFRTLIFSPSANAFVVYLTSVEIFLLAKEMEDGTVEPVTADPFGLLGGPPPSEDYVRDGPGTFYTPEDQTLFIGTWQSRDGTIVMEVTNSGAFEEASQMCLSVNGKPDFEAMTMAQMISGLTMQLLNHSRAASGAEHLMAHLVEMKPPRFENAHGMHGQCVGVGTYLCAKEYHYLASLPTPKAKPFEPLSRAWVDEKFGPLADGIMKENENDVLGTFDPQNIVDHWDEIRAIIAEIPSAEELAALCEKLGAFYKPEQIGIDPALSEDMLSVSAAIRNRLTLIRMRRVLDFGE